MRRLTVAGYALLLALAVVSVALGTELTQMRRLDEAIRRDSNKCPGVLYAAGVGPEDGQLQVCQPYNGNLYCRDAREGECRW